MKKLFLLIIPIISLPTGITGMDNSITVLTSLVVASCNNPGDDTYINAIARHIEYYRIDINNLDCSTDKKHSFLEFAVSKQHRKLIHYALAHHAYITPEILTTLRSNTWSALFYYHNLFKELTNTYPDISTLPTEENISLMNSYLAYRDWRNLLSLAKQHYNQQLWIATLVRIATIKCEKQTNHKKRKRSDIPWNDQEFVPRKNQRRD